MHDGRETPMALIAAAVMAADRLDGRRERSGAVEDLAVRGVGVDEAEAPTRVHLERLVAIVEQVEGRPVLPAKPGRPGPRRARQRSPRYARRFRMRG